FLLAGCLLSLASITIAAINGWNRGTASQLEQIVWSAASIGLALLSISGVSMVFNSKGVIRKVVALAVYLFSVIFTGVAAIGSQGSSRTINELTSNSQTEPTAVLQSQI